MGGSNRCAVCGCSNDRRYKSKWIIKDHVPELRFHLCPPKWRHLWLKLINRKDLPEISDHTRICSNHFVLGKPIGVQPHPSLYMRGYSDKESHSDDIEIQRIISSWSPDNDESTYLTTRHGKSAEDVPTKKRRTGLEDEASSPSPGPGEEAAGQTAVSPVSGDHSYSDHHDTVPSVGRGRPNKMSRRKQEKPAH